MESWRRGRRVRGGGGIGEGNPGEITASPFFSLPRSLSLCVPAARQGERRCSSESARSSRGLLRSASGDKKKRREAEGGKARTRRRCGCAEPAVSRLVGRMTGCAKRCKQGLVKFALSLHKLVTGTLIKGRSCFSSRPCFAFTFQRKLLFSPW